MRTKSDKQVHPIGIGTWGISSNYKPENSETKYRGVEPSLGNEDKEIEAIRYSITKGQNHIDCAEMYGAFYTDEVVGRAIEGMNREDLFIADKLWKTSVADGMVRATVNKMLQKLKTEYIDLLYIHAPWEGIPWEEAIPQIDNLIDEGIVRYFGVSNFSVEQMKRALSISKHPITANQMNLNVLYKDEVHDSFITFCEQNDIQIVAYQPIKRKEVLLNKNIQDIADMIDASPAQVAIAWLLAKGTLPIPKAVQKSHIDENLGALDVKLSREQIELLDSI